MCDMSRSGQLSVVLKACCHQWHITLRSKDMECRINNALLWLTNCEHAFWIKDRKQKQKKLYPSYYSGLYKTKPNVERNEHRGTFSYKMLPLITKLTQVKKVKYQMLRRRLRIIMQVLLSEFQLGSWLSRILGIRCNGQTCGHSRLIG